MTAAGWVVGLLVTALILWSPYLSSGFRSPSLHLMLDTADACIALLVAYLVHARFARRRYWQDRLLAQGLVLLAVAVRSGGRGRGPARRAGRHSRHLASPGGPAFGCRLHPGGGACRWSADPPSLPPPTRVAAAVGHRRAGVLGAVERPVDLPVAFDSASISSSAEHPLLTAHPALLVAQAFSAAVFPRRLDRLRHPVGAPRRRAAPLARSGLRSRRLRAGQLSALPLALHRLAVHRRPAAHRLLPAAARRGRPGAQAVLDGAVAGRGARGPAPAGSGAARRGHPGARLHPLGELRAAGRPAGR